MFSHALTVAELNRSSRFRAEAETLQHVLALLADVWGGTNEINLRRDERRILVWFRHGLRAFSLRNCRVFVGGINGDHVVDGLAQIDSIGVVCIHHT